jgi:light-regulated signal transduction histidine kinase (bacteriophytochrome)
VKFPSAFPVYRIGEGVLDDGYQVEAVSFCRERLARGESSCLAFYSRAQGIAASGFRMCPFGFTSLAVTTKSGVVAITGVVATPRFDDSKERERAKSFPSVRVSRKAVLQMADSIVSMDIEWQRIQEETRKKLPQALHELRKLNAIVKQGAEKLAARQAGPEVAENVAGAAQLMSNIFEVVEVLTNIEDVAISVGQELEFIAVFDLAYKAKKIYVVRAKLKPIHIRVTGDDQVGVLGSKKYFPIVLQVLLENAIKYGIKDSEIGINISRKNNECVLSVSNRSGHNFDPVLCFERGKRFADDDSEGDGLGLYLAREVVRAHQGTIWCELSGDLVTFNVKLAATSLPR